MSQITFEKRRGSLKRAFYVSELAAMALLAACAAQEPTPSSPVITETMAAAPTTPNTETPTPSIPTIEVGGLQIPDPHFSNPELFDLNNPESPIVQFAYAFGVAPEQVGKLTPELKSAADGSQFVVLTTSDLTSTANFDESGTPLLIAEQGGDGEWKWIECTPAKLHSLNDSFLESTVTSYILDTKGDTDPNNDEWVFMLDNPGYKKLVLESANRLFISGELNTTWVFSEFRKSDWDRVLSDWDNIKAQLDKHKLPTGFKYNWKASQDLIDFAIDNGLQVRGNLIFDDDVPQEFWAYSPDEAKKLLEFIVKTRVIKFGASINIWNIASEMVARTIYNPGFYTGEKLDAITSTQLAAQFAKEVDPEIRLAYVEDFVLENFPSPAFHNDYFKFIDRLQELGVPIDVLIIENNLWARSPIDREKVNLVFDEAKERNLRIEGGETTIALSSIYPNWTNRLPQTTIDDEDLLFIQAEMAAELKQIYRENGVTSFGFGAMDDITGWQARIGYLDSRSTLSPNYAGERKPIWYSFMAASLNDFK